MLNDRLIREDLLRWLQEDIGYSDITTDSIIGQLKKNADDQTAVRQQYSAGAVILAKQNGIIAGLPVAAKVFSLLDRSAQIEFLVNEGAAVVRGQIVMRINADISALLQGERLALNILQRASGIATKTNKITELVKDYPVRIADTRKTTPGFRWLEKYAVEIGGGINHRFGLYDGVLIKDNHIKIAGGIDRAIAAAKAGAPHTVKIEVETESLEQVRQALQAGADIIMLDNMKPEIMKQAVDIIAGRAVAEASGGITEDNIADVAACGVDVISLGALTHSAGVLDISLDIGEAKPLK